MSKPASEPFPPVASLNTNGGQNAARPARPRRKSSRLGGEPRGDTGAAALATMETQPTANAVMNPRGSSKLPKTSKRRKAKSLVRRWMRFSVRHTWVNPLILILVILGAYAANPTPSNPLHKAIFVSYPQPRLPFSSKPIQYGKGRADIAFCAFYVIVLTFTREFIMQRILRPLAGYFGIKSRAKQSRFMEQAYTAVYFSISGPFGLYVMSHTPVWYFNTHGMFEGYPHRTHEAIVKAYYLLQASYWAQQGLVLLLMLEKPRKDFKELVLHHIVTLSLIGLSYYFHFTYMGIAVYVTHDISDFFLASSKILNYLDSPITVPYFIFFISTWIYLRHYLNLRILWATATEFATVGPFTLDWASEQYKCWISQYVTFGLLATLQAVNMFWLFLILRILYRYITTDIAADDRSEDEEDDEEEEVPAGAGDSDVDAKTSGASGPAAAVRQRRAAQKDGAPQVLVNGGPAPDEAGDKKKGR